MNYLAIGLMSGSSLDGLDVVLARFTEVDGSWSFEIEKADCLSFTVDLQSRLRNATTFDALQYQLLDVEFGRFCGEQVRHFLKKNEIADKVDVICSHGHTTYHLPERGMTHQLGDGATIAAITGIPVVSDLRSLDVALGGEGAPIVPIGEKLLFPDYSVFLNIGGIANISFHRDENIIGFDVCPANRVLNMLAQDRGRPYDKNGEMATEGKVNPDLLEMLDSLEFYSRPYPKSLANSFGTDTVYPLIKGENLSIADALATYCQHIAGRIKHSVTQLGIHDGKMLITGGGAFNDHLASLIEARLKEAGIGIFIPSEDIVSYKEALIMALIGVLRLRNQNNTLASVTGASRDSCGGALWVP